MSAKQYDHDWPGLGADRFLDPAQDCLNGGQEAEGARGRWD